MNPPLASSSLANVYQFRIVIRGVSPMVWRRVLIPAETTLSGLHQILLTCLGWSGMYLHAFYIQGKHFGSNGIPSSSARMNEFNLHLGECFRYEYNFYDHWELDLRLEAVRSRDPSERYPRCLAGKGVSPTEDCGGAWSYLRILEERTLELPLDAMEVITRAAKELRDHPKEKPSVGMEELEEALERIRDYQERDPHRFRRRELNVELLRHEEAA